MPIRPAILTRVLEPKTSGEPQLLAFWPDSMVRVYDYSSVEDASCQIVLATHSGELVYQVIENFEEVMDELSAAIGGKPGWYQQLSVSDD